MKKRHFIVLVICSALIPPLCRAADHPPAIIDPAEAAKDPDFALQGEYVGMAGDDSFGVQVIALGEGEFKAVLSNGGLPGAGWDGEKPRDYTTGKRAEDGSVTFSKETRTGILKNGELLATDSDHPDLLVTFEKVERESPTLGAPAPQGAVVLFDGTGETAQKHWEKPVLDGDLLTQGAKSIDQFRDFSMHIEFLLPWMPTARGQSRGNSGLYLTGRYEVQMLDSFGLAGFDNECGGIYKVAEPRENICYPPLRWQTYDLEFTSAKFDAEGKKSAPAKLSLKHNGYLIHENLEIPGTTGGTLTRDENGPGPIFLQDHGNPVRYRNIWVLPR